MQKQLTEKTVYKPNKDVTVTVTNKPEVEEDRVVGYKRTVSIAINAGTEASKLTFSTDEDIAKYVETVNFEDPQQSLLG